MMLLFISTAEGFQLLAVVLHHPIFFRTFSLTSRSSISVFRLFRSERSPRLIGDSIKYPFWKMTAQNPKAVYACLNFGEAYAPDEIAAQSILINGDIHSVLDSI